MTAEKLMKPIDDAGSGISLAEWIDLLENLQDQISSRLDAARDDERNSNDR